MFNFHLGDITTYVVNDTVQYFFLLCGCEEDITVYLINIHKYIFLILTYTF